MNEGRWYPTAITLADGSVLVYDFDDWKRRCKFPHLGSPALCLIEKKMGPRTRGGLAAAPKDARPLAVA